MEPDKDPTQDALDWGVELINEVDLNRRVGSAICWLRSLLLVMIMTQAGLFIIALASAQCRDQGYPTIPFWIWPCLIPTSFFRNYVEWKTLSKYCLAYTSFTREGFKVLGRRVRFIIWLVFYLTCSNLNFLDIDTDSVFAAMAASAKYCSVSLMTEVWTLTWKQSIFGIIGMPVADLATIVLIVWAFTFLQLIIPLLFTFGRKDRFEKEVDGDEGDDEEFFFGTHFYNSDKVEDLSEALGLATIQNLSMPLRLANATEENVLLFSKPLTDQILKRFILGYVFENSLQINLQVTMFAINRYITGGQSGWPEWQALFSISLTLFLTSLKLYEAKAIFSFAKEIEDRAADIDLDSEDLALLKGFRRNMCLIYCAAAVLVASLAYACFKLIGAYWCEDSLINITGCVEIYSQLRQ